MSASMMTFFSVFVSAALLGSCAANRSVGPKEPPPSQAQMDEQHIRAAVLAMADDYSASLSEAMYLTVRSHLADPKARWLAQSFLRNGMGSTLDIASDPNPRVSLLDLLVLSSLQTWSFEKHWIPAGIGDAGLDAIGRLKQAEQAMWQSAAQYLTPEQMQTVRDLITLWIEANPDRTVVSLVRFQEFTSDRMQTSSTLRGKATGLLKEVTMATAAVDEARSLAERALWYAGRYPYVLGQQAELTAYRLADQPEVRDLLLTLNSLRTTSDRLSTRLDSIDAELVSQREEIFRQLTAEREATIESARQAVSQIVDESIDDLDRRVTLQRDEAIDRAFDRVSLERAALLDDLESRSGELSQLSTDLRSTLSAGHDLAREATTLANTVEQLVEHFDRQPGDGREPLRITDLRDAAGEARHAAENLTETLRAANDLAGSELWDQRLQSFHSTVGSVIDRAFWRAIWLVLVFLGGLGLLRLVPQRHHAMPRAHP